MDECCTLAGLKLLPVIQYRLWITGADLSPTGESERRTSAALTRLQRVVSNYLLQLRHLTRGDAINATEAPIIDTQ